MISYKWQNQSIRNKPLFLYLVTTSVKTHQSWPHFHHMNYKQKEKYQLGTISSKFYGTNLESYHLNYSQMKNRTDEKEIQRITSLNRDKLLALKICGIELEGLTIKRSPSYIQSFKSHSKPLFPINPQFRGIYKMKRVSLFLQITLKSQFKKKQIK